MMTRPQPADWTGMPERTPPRSRDPDPTPTAHRPGDTAAGGRHEFHPTFVAPCRDLDPRAPLAWLAAGWRDVRRAPGISLAWGLLAVAAFAGVATAAWLLGRWVLLISVLSGFVFIAPLMAFALYAVSRQLSLGRRPTFAESVSAARKPLANAMVFALILLVIFLLWARAGSMVHVFFPADPEHGAAGLVTFLAVGSAVGAVFALVAFAASAFSLPFIANRDVDVVTAVVSSINAVLRNKWTMLSWMALIGLFTLAGILTALTGFALIIPWLGYASWHGYRAALDVSQWPTLPDLPAGTVRRE